MDWNRLLSRARLGKADQQPLSATRTDFQRDFDRIVFSSALRRLHDKTQVFPLAQNDYVRTRLTHSLEASSVGRTLGTIVGEEIIQRYALSDVYPHDFGAIVAAACLAHDIGNPPFGHAGEDAIRLWFQSSASGQLVIQQLAEVEQEDFLGFEGNAQGFRLLTRLQSQSNRGGMQLTCATLGAFSKYPCAALAGAELAASVGLRKFGFFQAEQALFTELAEQLGLARLATAAWQRHPLAYLVEAADDICFRIIDIEDAYRLNLITFADASELLTPLAQGASVATRLAAIKEPKEKIEFLRAKAIGVMIEQAQRCFLDHETRIVAGELEHELLDLIPSAAQLGTLKSYAEQNIYSAVAVVEIGAAGFEVIGGLLSAFVSAINDVADHRAKASPKNRMLLHLLPKQFLGPDGQPHEQLYQRLLGVTDFVSGMTDSYAVALFKKITGISLPSH